MKKRIFSLLMSVVMIFTMSLCALAEGETTLAIEKIYGTKNAIYILFNKDVDVTKTQASIAQYDADTKFATTIIEDSKDKKYIEIDVSPALALDKKYKLDLNSSGEGVSCKIEYETLFFEDFDTATASTDTGIAQTNYFTVENGQLYFKQNQSAYSLPIKESFYKENGKIKDDWCDYTVEYEYDDPNSTKNMKEGTINQQYFGTYFYVQDSSKRTIRSNQLISTTTGLGLETSSEKNGMNTTLSYIQENCEATADRTDGKWNYVINQSCTTSVIQEDKKVSDNVVISSTSLFGTNVYQDLTVKGEDKPFYTATAKADQELKYTNGGFSVRAQLWFQANNEDKAGDKPAYIDNIRAYKLKAGDVEYTSSIPNGATDLYDVNSITINWNYDVTPLTADNIEVLEDEKSYTDFSIGESDARKTVINFNTKLLGEKTYTIKFKNVTEENGDSLTPLDTAFRTGGIYTKIDVVGNGILNAKDENSTQTVKVVGTTQSGNEFDIANSDIEYTSNNNDVIEVSNEGVLSQKDRGYAEINVKFTDRNTTNTHGDNGDNIFKKTIPAYSYMSVADVNENSDFSFKDGVVIANFTDDLTSEFSISFGENKTQFKTTATEYTFGDVKVARTNGNHKVEILKANNEKVSVYFDNEKIVDSIDATDLNTVSKSGNFTDVKSYNLIGNVCTVSFVNARGSDTLEAVYSYEDADNDKEEGTTIEWLSSSDGSSFTTIDGETSKTLNTASHKGKYIKVKITPKNRYDVGEGVTSDAVYVKANTVVSGGNNSISSGSIGGGGGVSIPAPSISQKPTQPEQKPASKPFTDVEANHWAAPSIANMKAKGVLNGFENGDFKPSASVTKGEFVCALSKLLNLQPVAYSCKFTDVKEGDWYSDYIEAIFQKGYIKGNTDGSFDPNAPITREQMASIIANILSDVEAKNISYGDKGEISDWALSSVQKAFAGGIMTGDENGNFNPKANITRAETAVILERLSNR